MEMKPRRVERPKLSKLEQEQKKIIVFSHIRKMSNLFRDRELHRQAVRSAKIAIQST
jgi:hypothetical protein